MMPSEKVLASFSQKKDLFGRRTAAMLIDYALLAAILLVADGLLGNDVYQKTIVLWLGICILYYPTLEGRYSVTLGKKIMSLRVVGLDLRPCGYRRATIRFLVRLIDANLLIPIFALFGRQKGVMG